jgi:hypothetical protein
MTETPLVRESFGLESRQRWRRGARSFVPASAVSLTIRAARADDPELFPPFLQAFRRRRLRARLLALFAR